jgi:hypothetical protein
MAVGLEGAYWMLLAQDRDQWQALVNKVFIKGGLLDQ